MEVFYILVGMMVLGLILLIAMTFVNTVDLLLFNGEFQRKWDDFKLMRRAKMEMHRSSDLDTWLKRNFFFYRSMPEMYQSRFMERMWYFYYRIPVSGGDNFVVTDDVRRAIAASFAQITFGLRKFQLNSVNQVIIFPTSFFSRLINKQVKGLTVFNGNVFLSWEAFAMGYRNSADKVNLAMHELAHVLALEDEDYDTEFSLDEWKEVAARAFYDIHSGKADGLFRKYGGTNMHEFWAVCVEVFFEQPQQLQKQYPDLYHSTAECLGLDILKLIPATLFQSIVDTIPSDSIIFSH